jgi:hypothetical protein
MEDPDIISHTNSHLIFRKGAKQRMWGKTQTLQQEIFEKQAEH